MTLLLPGDRGGLLFHVVTTMEGRKSGWLLEVANIDDCSLMVKYGDGKNHYFYFYFYYYYIYIYDNHQTLQTSHQPREQQ